MKPFDKIAIVYLDESNLSEETYLDFLKQYYGHSNWLRYQKKKEWYSSQYPYRILLAIVNGLPVGQNCVYKVPAVIGGKDTTISWGVDAFVLPKWRGNGIGKMLQKRLHEDCENFSSAWYSPINGLIKRKCNANEYFRLYFPYYAVSKWFSIYIELAIKKLFNKTITIPIRIPNLYILFKTKSGEHFEFEEVYNFDDADISFINKVLSPKDLYVKRDVKYMHWKYFNNPSLLFPPHIVRVHYRNQLIAIFSFTTAKKSQYISASVFTSILFDSFIDDRYNFSNNDIIKYIVKYHKDQGVVIDGIRSLQDIKYYPKIVYPIYGVPLLSTYNGKLNSFYLSLIDQDMEQIAM